MPRNPWLEDLAALRGVPWRERAACRGAPDPEVFFNNGAQAVAAYCSRCPVVRECAADAERPLPSGALVEGTWGALTGTQRAHARKVEGKC